MSNFNYLIEKVRHSSRDIVREFGLLSKETPYGIPLSTRHLLIGLEFHGSLTNVEISTLLKLDKSTISRLIKSLTQQKIVMVSHDEKDQRCKRILLTTSGKKLLERINQIAYKQVEDALLQLSEIEQQKVTSGLELYSKALKRSRIHEDYLIRPIQKKDNVELMMIIKKVLIEYGADRPGFAFVDPELENMHKAYSRKAWSYFVVERISDKKILGGAGIGPLLGAEKSICELKKMYLSIDARGLRLGYSLLQKVLARAKEYGYKQCYLETLHSMEKANTLYNKFEFTLLDKPLGDTGHFGCDAWYIKKL